MAQGVVNDGRLRTIAKRQSAKDDSSAALVEFLKEKRLITGIKSARNAIYSGAILFNWFQQSSAADAAI